MRNSLLAAVLGGVLLVACGDAGQNSSGYYRNAEGDTSDPSNPSNPANPANPSNPASPSNPSNPSNPSTPTTPAAAAKLDVMLDVAAPTVELNGEVKVTVSIVPKEGLTGKVDLTVTGMPAGVTATFDKTSVDIVGTAASSAILTVKSASDAVPATAPLVISAKPASGDAKTQPLPVAVNPVLTLKIPVNAAALTGAAANTAFAPADVKVKLGGKTISVKYQNLDSAPHIIHSGNTGGFNHGNRNAAIATNQFEGNVEGTNAARVINTAGTYAFYLHDVNPAGPNGRIVAE